MRKFAFTVAALTGAVALTAGATAAFASAGNGPGTSSGAAATAPANQTGDEIGLHQRSCGKILEPVLGVQQLAPKPTTPLCDFSHLPRFVRVDDARMTVVGRAR